MDTSPGWAHHVSSGKFRTEQDLQLHRRHTPRTETWKLGCRRQASATIQGLCRDRPRGGYQRQSRDAGRDPEASDVPQDRQHLHVTPQGTPPYPKEKCLTGASLGWFLSPVVRVLNQYPEGLPNSQTTTHQDLTSEVSGLQPASRTGRSI